MATRRDFLALALPACSVSAQVIEFESGGLRYLTQTRNGVTVMFAPLPVQIREYAVLQVAVSNGSSRSWTFRPIDFKFERSGLATLTGLHAATVVQDFMRHGGRDDVIKLVTTYENGLYGMKQLRSTNGYESRRQNYMAEVESTRLKAAAAASAIVFAQVKLKPGESTDGAVFYATGGRPLGPGKLVAECAGTVFEFRAQ
ncbi:MAG: hypothetical protein FJW39_07470 [Acidobacteria bacterium]|nr:hypothetical protein [Acidobacteriota bacterium]